MKVDSRPTELPYILIVAAIAAPVAVLLIIAISPELVLPVNYYLMIPISIATLALGALIDREGWSFVRSSGEAREYLSGVLLFVIGIIVSLVGVGGLMWMLIPWE